MFEEVSKSLRKSDNNFSRPKRLRCQLVHESLPKFKTELGNFLSALHHKAILETSPFLNGEITWSDLLDLLHSKEQHLASKAIARDLQFYYGILILFIIRVSQKTICNYSKADFHASSLQTSQDQNFRIGLNCPLYQPMLYALGASEMTFGKYLNMLRIRPALTDLPHLHEHYETAAHLLPVSIDAFILEHITTFFSEAYPAQNDDGLTEFRRRALNASAQLVTLPMA